MRSYNKSRLIYDPIYGFIKLTQVEWEIIHSSFYQRLRWIKQLGFSSYVFPGAEHSRFGHSIGVMYNAHHIISSCGRAVSDKELFNINVSGSEKTYHQLVRLGALMHDLGTFCFSHTTETAYIEFNETKRNSGELDNHEHLGAFIIKNSTGKNGITSILEKHNYDPTAISKLVKGQDPSIMANQILHSDVDCDRMDYLLRDAHYTGLRYGAYDRDYLLHHFTPRRVGNHDILTINYNALHCVEDFLMARFAWYSQVIRSSHGAKYDAIAKEITTYLLKNKLIYRYSELLDIITNDPVCFYHYNDNYFMETIFKLYHSGKFDKAPRVKAMVYVLLMGSGARTIRIKEFRKRLLNINESSTNNKIYKQVREKADYIHEIIKKKGSESDWIIEDIPKNEIFFVKDSGKLTNSNNVLLSRDPVKITYENNDIKLLSDVDSSVISHLFSVKNYIPNMFCSDSAYQILKKEGIIEEEDSCNKS